MRNASEPDPTSNNDLPGPPAPLPRLFLFVTLAFLASLMICCCLRQNASPSETGTITGRSTRLVSDWKGRIQRLLVEPGDSVQAGQPIAILLDEQLLLQKDRQKREVSEIQRALERAEQSAEEELTRQLAVLDADIVDLKTTLNISTESSGDASEPADEASARLAELETERLELAHRLQSAAGVPRIRDALILAKTELNRLEAQPLARTLPSPVTGTVGKLLRKPGERVVQGTPLIELADRDRPRLVVEVPELVAKRFALGDTIPLRFPGHPDRLGRVANMERLKRGESQVNVRLEIEPHEDGWPLLPLKSPVKVRTADSNAMSRRVH